MVTIAKDEVKWRLIVRRDRIKIGRYFFPKEKNISVVLKNIEAMFGLDALKIMDARIHNRGPDVVMKCNQNNCSGRMSRIKLLNEELASGAKVGFKCGSCGYTVLSNQDLSIWIDRGSKMTFKKAQEQGMLKPVPPLRENIKKFLKAEFGLEVIDKVYYKRLQVCGIGPLKNKCYNLKTNKGKVFCSACGCGFRQDAELYNKLKLAQVECPLTPPRFKSIDKKNRKLLKGMRWIKVIKRVYKSFINFFIDLRNGVYKKSVIDYTIKKLNYIIVKLRVI